MSEEQQTAGTLNCTARVATAQAEKYLAQLCKHFQHKRPVTYDQHTGHIGFTVGDCRLQAETGTLTLSVSAPDQDQLAQLQDVVVRHLLRFAFREELRIEWQATATEA